MVSLWKNYSMAPKPSTEDISTVLDVSRHVDELAHGLNTHEVMCEERWKTTFTRLETIEKGLQRIDSRLLSMGGIIIVFLAGLVVTLATTGAV